MKFKTLIKNFIFSQLKCVSLAITKAKYAIIEFVEETNLKNVRFLVPLLIKKTKSKLYPGSFRLYDNWSSSHLVPKSSIYHGYNSYVSCDPMWDSYEEKAVPLSQLSRYLRWLEEKGDEQWLEEKDDDSHEINEIDNLAEKYIANCHQKFILEKQESERKFQEMMARSM